MGRRNLVTANRGETPSCSNDTPKSVTSHLQNKPRSNI